VDEERIPSAALLKPVEYENMVLWSGRPRGGGGNGVTWFILCSFGCGAGHSLLLALIGLVEAFTLTGSAFIPWVLSIAFASMAELRHMRGSTGFEPSLACEPCDLKGPNFFQFFFRSHLSQINSQKNK
jgi:hypothetical protein